MLFNSLAFAIFLPIVFAVYWLLPNKYRWICLLVSSYYFYMSWNAKYVFLILGTTVVSYAAARLIEKTESKTKKKIILITFAGVCLGVLFVFKYLNFAMETLTSVMKMLSIEINPVVSKLLLPVGISFYTFQTLSYVIDVYKGKIKSEKHFGYYATFISFFPQLVAGPIERTDNLLPQIVENHKFNYSQATYGMKLMAWGFFKKMVVADVLAKYVDLIYNNLSEYKGFCLVVATFFFTIQIYCDFSGYSDIAIGTAKLMGINLMTNFRSPYFSTSIKEFWSRWHISLSTWFRDYVYIPLGGNRKGKFKQIRNLIVTFLLSGLWHGADWTFVIWGAMHGTAQVIENLLKKQKQETALFKLIKTVFVFAFCNNAWIFFRANSISDVGYIFSHWADGISMPFSYLKTGFTDMEMGKVRLLEIMMVLLILGIYDYLSLSKNVIEIISRMRKPIRYCFYLAIITFILCLRATSETVFVYFQF